MNTWMKEHGTDVTVTLEIAGRAEALATDIASQTQACLTVVKRDITEPTQQMETVGSAYRHAVSFYSLLKAWVEMWNNNGT